MSDVEVPASEDVTIAFDDPMFVEVEGRCNYIWSDYEVRYFQVSGGTETPLDIGALMELDS